MGQNAFSYYSVEMAARMFLMLSQSLGAILHITPLVVSSEAKTGRADMPLCVDNLVIV